MVCKEPIKSDSVLSNSLVAKSPSSFAGQPLGEMVCIAEVQKKKNKRVCSPVLKN